MKRFFKRSSSIFFTAILGSFLAFSPPAPTLGQSGDWEKEWEMAIQAAKNEGRLVYHSGNAGERYFQEFEKKFPGIKAVRALTRGGSQAYERLMAERRAGVYVTDIILTGRGSGGRLARASALDPLRPHMILPEVLDQSKWFEGRHYFADKDGNSLFKYASGPSADLAYNTKLVNPDEIKSLWDLLDSKWKGKIITLHPRVRGGRSYRYYYYNAELGPPYLKRLFGEMDLAASRDVRQITDWLAAGKYAIAFRLAPDAATLDEAKAQGLPVNWFGPGHFKEAIPITGGGNYIGMINKAPHPNVAKIFMNWFLSREGQTAVQRLNAAQAEGVDSLRIDIPKDMIPADYRREKNKKYFDMDAPDHTDNAPVFKLITEVWKRR